MCFLRLPSSAIGSSTDNHVSVELYDPKHGIKMGVPNGNCDDAQVSFTSFARLTVLDRFFYLRTEMYDFPW